MALLVVLVVAVWRMADAEWSAGWAGPVCHNQALLTGQCLWAAGLPTGSSHLTQKPT